MSIVRWMEYIEYRIRVSPKMGLRYNKSLKTSCVLFFSEFAGCKEVQNEIQSQLLPETAQSKKARTRPVFPCVVGRMRAAAAAALVADMPKDLTVPLRPCSCCSRLGEVN